ncbi:hypothetical protein BgiBS90_028916 [Biomphalaria glabrata]|nr:hypothetical protein BgiBS90_028916 [Biomphalaria glabrata]
MLKLKEHITLIYFWMKIFYCSPVTFFVLKDFYYPEDVTGFHANKSTHKINGLFTFGKNPDFVTAVTEDNDD